MRDLETVKAEMNKIRYELNEHRRAGSQLFNNRALAQAELALDRFDVAGLTNLLDAIRSPEFGFNTPEYLAYERTEKEIIGRYNTLVGEHNAILQARRNEREVARTRAAMCQSCFTVHGAGQGECW